MQQTADDLSTWWDKVTPVYIMQHEQEDAFEQDKMLVSYMYQHPNYNPSSDQEIVDAGYDPVAMSALLSMQKFKAEAMLAQHSGGSIGDIWQYTGPIAISAGIVLSGGVESPNGGVYTLTNSEGKVERVGHTKNFKMRKQSYYNDPNFRGLDFNPIFKTDSYPERRGLEQYLYEEYDHPPLNKNRPISPRNDNLEEYIQAASNFLSNFGISWP